MDMAAPLPMDLAVGRPAVGDEAAELGEWVREADPVDFLRARLVSKTYLSPVVAAPESPAEPDEALGCFARPKRLLLSPSADTLVAQIEEPGPLGMTLAVLQEDVGTLSDQGHRDFVTRIVADPHQIAAEAESGTLPALGGLRLDDRTLAVTAVAATSPTIEPHPCRAVDGRPLVLVIGSFTLALFESEAYQRQRGGPIASFNLHEMQEWGMSSKSELDGPEAVERSRPYMFLTARDGVPLKLFASRSQVATMCDSIMRRAEQLVERSRAHSAGREDFFARLRGVSEIAWCEGARVGMRLVAINGTAVETVQDAVACFAAGAGGSDDSTAGSWVTTLTLRSGPLVIGHIDPDGIAMASQPSLMCGLRLLSVNDEPTEGRSFEAISTQIKTQPRPLHLTFLALSPPPAAAPSVTSPCGSPVALADAVNSTSGDDGTMMLDSSDGSQAVQIVASLQAADNGLVAIHASGESVVYNYRRIKSYQVLRKVSAVSAQCDHSPTRPPCLTRPCCHAMMRDVHFAWSCGLTASVSSPWSQGAPEHAQQSDGCFRLKMRKPPQTIAYSMPYEEARHAKREISAMLQYLKRKESTSPPAAASR